MIAHLLIKKINIIKLFNLNEIFMLIKKIAIVGYGYVGKGMYNLFKNHYNTIIYDPNYNNSCTINDVNECDLAVVCVPTPKGDNGECDISYVEGVISWIDTPLILLKSTVEVGTTDKLKEKFNKKIVFSPEYAGETTYWSPYSFRENIVETPFFIFGGEKEHTSAMVDIFMPICGPTKVYKQTDTKSAELAKYMTNNFYAMKIAFCYEMYEIIKSAGCDYNEVRELWVLDPRLNPMFTSVFAENDRPFGGKCFPKDTSALASLAEKNGYDAKLIKEVIATNERIGEIRKSRKNK